MNNIYDFIVIGAGISACTFVSLLNKRFSDVSILLVEHGRKIGGRATTRNSRKNTILEFDHGLPSISFHQNTSQDIINLISPLINSKKLVDVSNNILLMNQFGFLNKSFTKDKIYRSVPYMVNFCEEIINQSTNPEKINYLFQTLTKSIKRVKELWEIEINNGRFIQSKNLILSSSLLAHPRCLEILKTKSIPLRDAFIPGEDVIVDSVLLETSKLNFLKRKIYILYVSNLLLVQNLNHQYLQIIFSNIISENLNFERIVFQRQIDGSMVILLHCSYIDNIGEINIENIIESLKSLFINYREFLDLFSQAKLIDKMDWRASQPIDNLLHKKLQWSSSSKIGFCGDWFDMDNSCGSVESAIRSSIRLSKILTWK